MGHAFPLRVCLVALACVLLASCGRKGVLEPPPGSTQSQSLGQNEGQTAAQQARILSDQDTPGLIQSPNKFYEEPADVKLERAQRKAAEAGAPRPINAPPVDKARGFVLDPLL